MHVSSPASLRHSTRSLHSAYRFHGLFVNTCTLTPPPATGLVVGISRRHDHALAGANRLIGCLSRWRIVCRPGRRPRLQCGSILSELAERQISCMPRSLRSVSGDAKPSIIIAENVVGDVVDAAQNDDLMTKATNCTRLLLYHCQRDSVIRSIASRRHN